ncbi:glycosyltransferase [Clostridium sartagoforme AAU1]|uniref:Glycosyltransferase n=1 Tax=Clostridium sartagoforme AAU1 TaxID=1202534 RepID=R9CBP4_9CLOT|nr:glycosyltransferase [Clostridium sartagoforme]EOR24631.1 glycosyltransferase [Clostridium sartagoforme AAU1]
MKNKICHISTAHKENDSRILLKECQSLSKAGYDVSLIINSNHDKTLYGTNIKALDYNNTGRLHRFFKKSRIALDKAIELDADLYHFHDPELIKLGMALKKKGKKVIYDVHEDVPKQILAKSYLGPIWIRKIISRGYNFYEKNRSKSFDAIIAASDELAAKFDNKSSISVKNFAIRDVIENAKPIKRENNDKFVIIYVGSITKIRGIRELIQVTELFLGKVELWILGPFESEELKKECMSLEGYKYCKYFGSLPVKDVYSYIKAADLGMCTLYPTENYKESIPIKVLEYMACEKPLVLSDFEFWKKFFGNVGKYVDPLDINSIKEGIEYFSEDRSRIEIIGKENKESFINNFSWDREEKKLLELYKKVLK